MADVVNVGIKGINRSKKVSYSGVRPGDHWFSRLSIRLFSATIITADTNIDKFVLIVKNSTVCFGFYSTSNSYQLRLRN